MSFVERYLPSTPMLEYFFTRKSFYNGFHTASKLVFSVSMILVTVYLKSVVLAAVTPLVALLVIVAARLSLKTFMSWSSMPVLFVATLCVFLPLVGYSLTEVALVFVKAVTAAWFMLLLALTTPITNLARLASKLLPSWLADTFVLVSRYFFPRF